MNKRQNQSALAGALHVSLSIILISISAILVATSFMAAPEALQPPAYDKADRSAPALPAPETVALPNVFLNPSLPVSTVVLEPVTTTNINSAEGFIGFQGDFTFDETVCTFASPFVEPAGLTAGSWNVSGNILSGPGPIRTLRVSAFVNDGITPLSGSGILYNLRMVRVSGVPSASTQLIWQPDPDNFIFIDTDLNWHAPTQVNGSVTIGPTGTCTTTTFSNPGTIAIPGDGSSGIALPYPSSIIVSGMTAPIREMSMHLNGLSHGHPKDIDVLLVGPQGQNTFIMSDAGGYFPVENVNLFLNDNFRFPLPDGGPLISDSYSPTDRFSCEQDLGDTFPGPAPFPSGFTAFTAFYGTDPNGTWSLYVVDDREENTGAFAGGWDLTIRSGNCPTPIPEPSPSASPFPSFFFDVSNHVIAGVPFNFTLFRSGGPYSGTIHFTSSDPSAVLPADTFFNGTSVQFTATLNSFSSHQSITVTDTQQFHITGTSNCITVDPTTPTPTPSPLVSPCPGCTNTPTPTPLPFCATTTFSNSATITIPASGSSGIASIYPSTITVSGLGSSIARVSVRFHGFTHSHPKDIDMLLVGPQGQNAIIMSDAGGYGPITGLDFQITPASFPMPNGGPMFGDSFGAANWTDCDDAGDVFPVPAPIPSGFSGLGVFDGTNPNGTWTLYVVDDKDENVGVISGGWDLILITAPCIFPSPTPVFPGPTHFEVVAPSAVTAGVPFSFTVTPTGGGPNPGSYPGTIHFTSSDSSAVLPPDATATPGGVTPRPFTATLNQVSTSQTITVNGVQDPLLTGTSNCVFVQPKAPTPTPSPTPIPACGTFSNSSTVAIPASGSGGVASPYPSNITVSGVGGAITKVTVSINGISHEATADIDVLLVGPSGQTAIIMSDSGNFSSVTGINLVLDDTAANSLPGNPEPLVSGTFRPTNFFAPHCAGSSPIDEFPVPAPYPSGGSALSTFNGTNANGIWSLYVVDDLYVKRPGSFSGGWAITIATADCAGPTPTPMPTPTPGASHFALDIFGVIIAGFPLDLRVTALDRFHNAVTNYPGTVHFTSSDMYASLPPDSTLPNGSATFTVSFGDIWTEQTMTATDVSDPSITGTSACVFINKPTPGPTQTPTPPTVTPSPIPTPSPTSAARALNLSTRLLVQGGENVGIGGFIIIGTGPRQVLLRGIGPSLGSIGVPNPLVDPVLELHGPGGFVTVVNNNWKDTQEAAIIATGIPPSDDLESAVLVTVDPGSYTAILKGNNDGTGVGLVEIYDLSSDFSSKLGNLSTRAFVGTGNDIVISGFILGGGSSDDAVVIRGIGPSLRDFGISNALADPMLELRNSNGALIAANDNWQDGPPGPPITPPPGGAPTNPLESVIDITLSPGAYTALLSGVNNGTGVGLIEVYDRGTP